MEAAPRTRPWHRDAIRRLGMIAVRPGDDQVVQTQKATLTVTAAGITIASTAWVVTYLLLGLPLAAAIPFGYQVVTVIGLVLLARTKAYREFRFLQATLMSVLPFVLQWTLGGYLASGAVSLWGIVTSIGTLFFFTASQAVPWFIVFLALTLVSAVLEPTLAMHAAAVPDNARVALFVLDVGGISIIAYVLLQSAVRARDAAFARSESLLLNVLPRSIADRLRREPGTIADAYDGVTVLFADIVDFTPFAARTEPHRVLEVLDELFSAFDGLAARHGIEKIKTIGDAYMVASGLPEPRADHAVAMAEMALDMRDAFTQVCGVGGFDVPLRLRIGMDSGPVIAGVIGRHKFAYDLWGDTVNTASRMESHGIPGEIQVSDATWALLRDRYSFEDRGSIEIKGKGRTRVHLLAGRLAGPG